MANNATRFPAKATFHLPLEKALRELWEIAQTVEPAGPAAKFGREFLNLDKQALAEWYPQAWWGHYAINACLLRFNVPERQDEVMAVLRKVDFSPIEELAREGRGVLVTMGHLGVLRVLGCYLWKAGRPALRITRSPLFQHPSVDVSKRSDPDYLAKLHVRALFHLREGGIVFLGPDGGQGRKFLQGRFFGRTVCMPRASPALARMSGAPTLPYISRWDGLCLRHIACIR